MNQYRVVLDMFDRYEGESEIDEENHECKKAKTLLFIILKHKFLQLKCQFD